MKAQTAVVLGATGFIGGYLVSELINDAAISTIRVLVRRKVTFTNAKVQVVVVDFENADQFKSAIGSGEVIFCCIGTTMKAVKGDKAKYRKIDFDIAVDAARYGKAAGFTQYLLVSSAGADAQSGNFYTLLKGEVEEAIKSVAYPSLQIFRPSFLLGQRQEFRLGEWLTKAFMKLAAPLFVGGLQPYRAIQGQVVAKAMANAAKQQHQGTSILIYPAITALASEG